LQPGRELRDPHVHAPAQTGVQFHALGRGWQGLARTLICSAFGHVKRRPTPATALTTALADAGHRGGPTLTLTCTPPAIPA
jgi:hypothetical protein